MPHRFEVKKRWGPACIICRSSQWPASDWFPPRLPGSQCLLGKQRLYRQDFNNIAGDYATALQNGLNEYLDKMRATRAFYNSSIEVDRDEFTLFTDQILAGYGDAMRLLWCPRVTGDERAAFERKQRAGDIGDFSHHDVVGKRPHAGRTPTRRVFSDRVLDDGQK